MKDRIKLEKASFNKESYSLSFVLAEKTINSLEQSALRLQKHEYTFRLLFLRIIAEIAETC